MPAPWLWASVLVTMIASVLDRLVYSQRQPGGQGWLRLYLYLLRHPLQALRDFGWGVWFVTLLLLFFLSPFVIFGAFLLVDHSTSMLYPGCFWPIVVLPPVAVVGFVWGLRKNRMPQTAQRTPEGPAAEPDR